MAFPPDKGGPAKKKPQGPPQGGPPAPGGPPPAGGMPPGMDPMAGPAGMPGMDPTAGGIDPMMMAGMGSPLAQAGMPMIGGPPQPHPLDALMGGMGGAMDDPMAGGMPPGMDPAMMGGDPGGMLPPGGAIDPEGASGADSPLLSALMAQLSPGMTPGGPTSLQGIGPPDPKQMGLQDLLNMLGLAGAGIGTGDVQPQPSMVGQMTGY